MQQVNNANTQPVSTNITQSKNTPMKIFTAVIILCAIVFAEYFLVKEYVCEKPQEQPEEEITETPKGMMILIEYKDTVGLINFVNELQKRNISSLLLVSPDFVETNCEDIKTLLDYNVEIVGSNPSGEFWDVAYEEQYNSILGMKTRIEACTGNTLRFVSSRYMASDENTAKAAEELGVEYLLARGTTDLKATVYKPEEYDVKILSVSNIPRVEFKYGSLCDYSFYERAGTPDDMYQELMDALEEGKFTSVTHTNIGGYKKQWYDMWIEFFDNNEINWLSVDEFMEIDKTLPMWQIPTNKNAPYTPEKIRPLIPYDEEENVENPCAVEELQQSNSNPVDNEDYVGEKLVMFHNGTGPMCLDALEFIEEIDYTVEEHLDTENDFWEELNELQDIYGSSEGVSTSFGYYPIIFIQDRAYSGFNDEIAQEILELIQ